MSIKRSRATYEADLQAQQSPYVVYGKPLPPRDPEVRDDGSYVPIWKQEVTDERGRKRLHGAFTGGFSAGYVDAFVLRKLANGCIPQLLQHGGL
jgi:G patch domain-containing protein 1